MPSGPELEVRGCTADDLRALVHAWPTAGVHEAHHARHATGETTYLVAWRGPEPLGAGVLRWAGCVGERARTAFPDAVEIHHLQVRDGARGLGVGTALITAAEDLLRAAGRPRAAVGVGVDNPDAERLYARLGYRPTGVEELSEYRWTTPEGEVRHESERDRLLVKDL